MTWQLFAAWLATAASPAPAVPAPDAQVRAEEPAPPGVDVIETAVERYRRLTVPVTIEGAGPFSFLIDTGAQATVLSHDLATQLQLNDRKLAIVVGMASRRTTETVHIPELTLGSRSFYIRSAPLLHAEHIGDVDGILGLDSLQDQRVLIDFEEGRMAVDDAEQLGGNRGFEIVVKARRRLGQLIITRARIDGVTTAVVIDTGAETSLGNPALLKRLRRSRALGPGQLTDVNGVEATGTVLLAKELELQDIRLANVAVMIVDAPPFHALGLTDEPALILGMRELTLFKRVAIDFHTRQILFDLPRQPFRFGTEDGRQLRL